MKIIKTDLKDCYIIEPAKFGDKRGYFSPYFIQNEFSELGFKNVVQTNRSMSSKGVLRGLHFQKDPKCQAKIVEVINGKAVDVVVDMRIDSPSYGKYIAVELTAQNSRQLFVPRGFAHGFIALEDNTIFQYIVDNDYAPKFEAGIKWDDKDININWQELFQKYNITKPVLSEKDQILPTFKDNKVIFKREDDKYLITGYNGQLGYDIKRVLLANGIAEENILATDIDNMDITNKEQVNKVIKNFAPNVIFHCAAWTAVDKAEDNPDLVRKINVEGTKNIVDASIENNAKIVYLSTDYVFDGTKNGEYKVDDKVNPKSVYGLTKYEGEELVRKNPHHYIARISWVFGINGHNFIRTMLNLSQNHSQINVVDDQIGSPTYTVDLAKFLVELAQTDKYGTYHATNEGFCSWAEFAEFIFKTNNKEVKVNHVSTEEYLKITGTKQAYRPKNSCLDKSKISEIGLNNLPTWQNAVLRYNEELKEETKVLERIKK